MATLSLHLGKAGFLYVYVEGLFLSTLLWPAGCYHTACSLRLSPAFSPCVHSRRPHLYLAQGLALCDQHVTAGVSWQMSGFFHRLLEQLCVCRGHWDLPLLRGGFCPCCILDPMSAVVCMRPHHSDVGRELNPNLSMPGGGPLRGGVVTRWHYPPPPIPTPVHTCASACCSAHHQGTHHCGLWPWAL